MTNRVCCVAMVALVLASGALAQDEDLPLRNWGAPPYWTPPAAAQADRSEDQMQANAEGMTAQTQALPSSPLPFVAIAPCRIVDTRVAVADGFHEPNFSDNETRVYDFPTSADCPGLPATAGAWSVNVQYRPISVASYITLFPTGTTMPLVSTLVGNPAGFTADAAIVPAGTSGQIDVYSQFAARVVIDINGYYGPQSVVTSLNTLTGPLTLASGSNIAITPSGNTLTVAMSGIPGGTLPAGTLGQTLYSNGSGWLASSALTNDGTDVGISGNLILPATTATTGQISLGGNTFVHGYGGPGTFGDNVFIGKGAGNFTMGGATLIEGSENVGVGLQSFHANTTGFNNTAIGGFSMYSNTTGDGNTASGYNALEFNTSGGYNTASGLQSLTSNTTGSYNTGDGYGALGANTTGYENTASGFAAGNTNSTGFDNTFIGATSDAAVDGLFNATAVGFGAVVDAANHIRIGDTNVTQIGGQVAWSNLSDARAKTEIRDLELGLELVMALRPVAFSLKTGDGRTDMGFLAQDVEAVLGDGYSVLGIGGDPDRTLSLRYADLIAPLVKAVQEQQALIEAQRKEIEALKARLAGRDRAIERRVAALERDRRQGASHD
jgi:hypothetical protein